MIVARRFREDLYYRLRVVEMVIPPLRERLSDLPLLVERLVARAAESLGVPPPVLSPAAMDHLLEHSWPGNVRELENCIKRAVVIASGSVIRAEHFSFTVPRSEERTKLSSLDDVEREQVLRVLAATGNHKGRAAAILGVSRPRLRRLMEKYGLE
jgi:DNA-binding NtrC family response regulator